MTRKAGEQMGEPQAAICNKICKLRFQIGWDEKGYFLNQVAGNPNHPLHPRVDSSKIPTLTRLIPEEEKRNL
jgi:hypothetical protein